MTAALTCLARFRAAEFFNAIKGAWWRSGRILPRVAVSLAAGILER
jgi:hypothetical protein